MPEFETRLTLPQPRDKVFDFLVRTEYLLQLIPPDSQMKVVSVPEILQTGSRLEFEATAFGQSVKIVHEITDCVTPHRLTEMQIQGLFKRWQHVHLVEDDGEGRSVAIDRIEFEPPTGLLGFIVTRQRIVAYLESLFAHRHQLMRKVLGPAP